MKAITVFDLDRTLLTEDKRLSQENQAALAQLRAHNVLPVIATGRDYFEVQDIITAGAFKAVVSANGAEVSYGNRRVASKPIPPVAVKRLLAWAGEMKIPIAFSHHDGITLSAVSPLVKAVYQHIHKPLPPLNAFDPTKQPVTKGLIYLRDEPANQALERSVRQIVGADLYRNSPRSIDVVAPGVTKADGLAALTKALHAENVPVYAFGDGNNDVRMLEQATVGVAMGNAAPAVQAHADYVTAPFDQGGIVAALRHFELI